MKNSVLGSLLLMAKGGAIGVANIIPGVSGGTFAVILGIYDRLIEAISGVMTDKGKRVSHIVFLAKVFIGAGVAVVALARVMDFLLSGYYQETMFLFMGLIIGGLPAVVMSHGDMRIRTTRLLAFFIGVMLVLGLSLFGNEPAASGMHANTDFSIMNIQAYLLLVIAGILAGGAMIVPGISGSFILVLIGQYAVVIAAIKEVAVKPLACMGAGAAAGVFMFSGIIKICMRKFPADTYYFIIGLIAASLYKIFPGLPADGQRIGACVGALFAGGVVSYLFSGIKSGE